MFSSQTINKLKTTMRCIKNIYFLTKINFCFLRWYSSSTCKIKQDLDIIKKKLVYLFIRSRILGII